MHALERPTLSVVVATDDQSFVDELEDALSPDADVIVVSTDVLRVRRARTIQVLPLESSYRRNRGLLLAQAAIVAFLEEGQLPSRQWPAAVRSAFADAPRPAAAVGDRTGMPLQAGGNVAYDRGRLLTAHGFPLFTGAPPGSPLPDLLALLRLRAAGERITLSPQIPLARRESRVISDARRVGRAARVNKKPALAARAAAAAVRRGAVRDLLELVAGALVDHDWAFELPEEARRMPPAIAEAVGMPALVPLPIGRKGKLHFLYRAGELLVHVYINPTDHLRAAVAAREAIHRRSSAPGIPRVHASAESVDALWLVEDFVRGERLDPAQLREAADRVARWVLLLAGPPGGPLATVPGWRAHAAELLGAGFPADATESLGLSLQTVEHVPARHLHGDLNPRNVLVDGERLAAVDWENAALEFIPGLDLVFLFLVAEGSPDERVVLEPTRIAPYLRELGLDGELVPHALRVMLATWALGERKRRARLGVDPGPAVFEPLFLRSEGLLA